jgi:hypothetical protein
MELPISTDIFHIKAHHDQTKSWAELNGAAKINVLADKQAAKIYRKAKKTNWPLPHMDSRDTSCTFP